VRSSCRPRRRVGRACGSSQRDVSRKRANQPSTRYLTRLSRSAIRVCQPAPVERQRAMTSAGRRMVISCLGFFETGRPPFFTTARASISSVSSGSSRYSCARVTCASTRRRFDFKVRRCALFLTGIGFPHAEYVLVAPSRGVANNDQSPSEMPITEHSGLAIRLTCVLDLKREARKDHRRIFKVETSLLKRPCTFDRIVGNGHRVIVTTRIPNGNPPEYVAASWGRPDIQLSAM